MNDQRRTLGCLATAVMAAGFLCGSTLAQDDVTIGGKSLSDIMKQLRGDNRGFQLRAARTLSEAPADVRPKVVAALIPVLKSDRENDRFVAAQVLGEYGPVARSAVPHLLPVLEGTEYERNRAAASKALGMILKDAEPSEEVETVTKALVKLFPDKYSDVRREAVTACGMIGPAAKTCVPDLKPRFDDTEWLKDAECFLVRRAAAWTTGRMGEHGRVHIDKLIGMLHGNSPVATEFIDAIGELGPVHQNVVPNVVDKLEKTIYGGYQGANGEQLSNYVQHGMAVLERFGSKSASAVDFLTRLLGADQVNRDPARTVAILKVMGAIGAEAGKAAAVIEKNCLSSSKAEVKAAAEAALAKIKTKN